MINTSLCELATTVFFSARSRIFEAFRLRDRDVDTKMALQKIPDREMFRIPQKRDCKTLEISLNFCTTFKFLEAICHPL